MKLDFAGDAVALVEDAEDRNPLGHWGDSDIAALGPRGGSAIALGAFLLAAFPACAERDQQAKDEWSSAPHLYSGFHGS